MHTHYDVCVVLPSIALLFYNFALNLRSLTMPPLAVDPDEPPSIMNTHAFSRLYWSILDPAGIASVQVAEENDDASSPSGNDLPTHPIALKPATTTGANKLSFTAECLGIHESQWNDGFEPPEDGVENLEDAWDYFVIETADGSPVLVRDVITRFHAWAANPFIGDKIRESMAWMYNAKVEHHADGWSSQGVGGEDDVDEVPEGTKIFFEEMDQFGNADDNGVPVIYVRLWVEGFDGKDADYFWKSRIDPAKYWV
jgi:hypothetical protein